jgi:transcriptional regulator with GAF, ATPase, and Fis domain
VQTTRVLPNDRLAALIVPRFRARVVAGPNVGLEASSTDGRLVIGTAEGVALRLDDRTVSRFHLEIEAAPDGMIVRDLGSTNGSFIHGLRVRDVVVPAKASLTIDLGQTRVAIVLGDEPTSIDAGRTSFGSLIGSSPSMRAVFAALERVAPTNAPILITGESGTGKELTARAVHAMSPRADKPFEVVDCGGLPPTLIEAELFGYERGAFTGAMRESEGAFERADGGTLFLDELGELPLELQPKLLRVLGEKEIRRIGARKTKKIDVRIVAATNRDVRRAVNDGSFRADLFYRLAVIQVRLPPLRERPSDLPLLVDSLVEAIAEERGLDLHFEPDPDLLKQLEAHAWPGNVRELRNYLEQLILLAAPPDLPSSADGSSAPSPASTSLDAFLAMPLRAAKEDFERRYVEALLAQTNGNVAEAARRAGIDRVTLFRTIRRYGLRGGA